MIEKRVLNTKGFGIFTTQKIKQGTLIFSGEDWVEDEQHGWFTLSPEELGLMSPDERQKFLRYGYDKDFGKIIGTLDWEHARHVSNFMNHSCRPNLTYDNDDNIIALTDIGPGDELTIDYGNFIVNVDQDFTCSCGAPNCRGAIKKDDWRFLAEMFGIQFPRFMQGEVAKLQPVRV